MTNAPFALDSREFIALAGGLAAVLVVGIHKLHLAVDPHDALVVDKPRDGIPGKVLRAAERVFRKPDVAGHDVAV